MMKRRRPTPPDGSGGRTRRPRRFVRAARPGERNTPMLSPPRSEQFLRDCDAPAPPVLEVEREGRPGTIRHALEAPFALLGRDERNHLCLPDEQVSRRHAYLQVLAGGLFCVDLGSRTGVFWDGEARPAGWVAPGDRLRVGPFTLRLAEGPPRLAPPDGPDRFDPLAADPAPAAWALELPGGVRWRVNRALTLLGKSSRCKLRPNAPEASRFHCGLVRAPGGVWVVDLLSSRGTYVNGERARCDLLEEGAELRVGRVVLHLRGEASAAGGVSVALADGEGAACLPAAEPDVPAAAAEGAASPEAPAPLDHPLLPRAPAGAPQGLAPAALRPLSLPGAASSELQEVLLGPVISQFSLMQQQMLEQFHQTLVMMAQVFGNLHRDQMALIRDELNQLHQVTQELQALHVELARRPAEGGAGPEGPAEGAPAAPAGGTARSAPEPAPAPAHGPAGAPPEAARGQRPGAPPPLPPPGAEAIHDLLRQRMAALEEERKSRWDKILRFMLGK
jgi:pSer/pThr/pTyr-binding forkhead associated (FHA) protein